MLQSDLSASDLTMQGECDYIASVTAEDSLSVGGAWVVVWVMASTAHSPCAPHSETART